MLFIQNDNLSTEIIAKKKKKKYLNANESSYLCYNLFLCVSNYGNTTKISFYEIAKGKKQLEIIYYLHKAKPRTILPFFPNRKYFDDCKLFGDFSECFYSYDLKMTFFCFKTTYSIHSLDLELVIQCLAHGLLFVQRLFYKWFRM